MRHLFIRLSRKAAFELARDLLGRPVAAELCRYCAAQERVASQLACLGSKGAIPCRLIRSRCPIGGAPAIAPDFTADGRRRATQLPGNGSERSVSAEPTEYLFAFIERQGLSVPPTFWRANPTRRRDHRKHRRRLPIKHAADRTHRQASLPTIPNLGALCG